MNTKHTPGPWKCVSAGPGVPADAAIFSKASPVPIAEVISFRDAPLIAAAPELLAELQAAHRIIQNALNIMSTTQKTKWAARNFADGVTGEGDTRAHERMAAIAKARGQQ